MPTDNQTVSTRSAVSNIMQLTEAFLGECQAELTRSASVRRDEASAFVKELRQSAQDRLGELKSALSNEARSTRENLNRFKAGLQRDASLARHDARTELKSISEARLAAAVSEADSRAAIRDVLAKASKALTDSLASDRKSDTQSLLKDLRDFSDMLRKEDEAATAERRRALGSDEPRFKRSGPAATAKRRTGSGTLAAVNYTVGKRRRPHSGKRVSMTDRIYRREADAPSGGGKSIREAV